MGIAEWIEDGDQVKAPLDTDKLPDLLRVTPNIGYSHYYIDIAGIYCYGRASNSFGDQTGVE